MVSAAARLASDGCSLLLVVGRRVSFAPLASPTPASEFHLLSRRPLLLLLLLLLLILLVPGSALAGAAPALWREGSLGGEEDGEGGGGD